MSSELTIYYTIATLSIIGVTAAVILYLTARRFHVDEDPRIDKVESMMPGANCGGCGYPGCRNFAEACVKADNLSKLFCPTGGNECMASVAHALGKDIPEHEPLIAVVRCAGTPEHRTQTSIYDSAGTCAISASTFSGDTGCQYGCVGLGDCVSVCNFNAIYIDNTTKLPFIIEENCNECGACVKACPKAIIELRKKGPKNRRVFVSCVNKEKGVLAKKTCSVACIGCGLCVKECPFDAIKLESNLAYIDFEKCRLCRKCVSVCPTKAIWEINFPAKTINAAEKNLKNEKNTV